jgi:hypothetical protein
MQATERMIEESESQRRRFAYGVAAVFLILTVPRLLLHELWRDEAWLWLVVTESRSFGELAAALGRSGEGYLFPLLCVLARQVSASPRAMQFLHLVLVVAASFVFARWATFRRWERALFLLGYFPFYEYAVISRHYVVGMLLLWLSCAAIRNRWPPLVLGGILGLLCQTTVYGSILAIAVACGWLLDRWLRRGDLPRLKASETLAGLALALSGFLAGLVQMVPLPGTSFAPGWNVHLDPAHASQTLMMAWRSFVPLPRPWVQYWNTNLLDPWPALQAAGGLLMLILAAAILWRRKAALVTFCVGAVGILIFGYIKYIGVMRHSGHLWLLFVAALWLGDFHRVPDERRSSRGRVFPVLLLVQCAVGAFASWVDLRHPFSNGSATAALMRREGLDRHPLLGYREPPAASVALPLGRPLYSPSRGIFTTHPDYGPMQRELSDQELRCSAREMARREGEDIVLVMNRELPPWEELTPAGSTSGAIVATEDYHLYWLRYARLGATAQAARCGAGGPQSPGALPPRTVGLP